MHLIRNSSSSSKNSACHSLVFFWTHFFFSRPPKERQLMGELKPYCSQLEYVCQNWSSKVLENSLERIQREPTVKTYLGIRFFKATLVSCTPSNRRTKSFVLISLNRKCISSSPSLSFCHSPSARLLHRTLFHDQIYAWLAGLFLLSQACISRPPFSSYSSFSLGPASRSYWLDQVLRVPRLHLGEPCS